MTTPRLTRHLVSTFALCYLSTTALSGCGSTSNNVTNTPNTLTSASATACAQPRSHAGSVTGIIQSVNGQTIHITQSTGEKVDATYSNTTRITQQKLANASVLQQGTTLLIQAQRNSNGTYTAKSIILTQGDQSTNGARQGQQSGNNNGVTACFGGSQGQRRVRGNSGEQTNSQRLRALSGTIGQITGTTFTITDRQQNTHSIMVASDTKIIQTTSATSSTIQTGMGIRVTGPNNNGVITASSIIIYDPGLLPTPTPSTT